jgi:predicted nuclease of predicted toxin-antitoxin system
MKFLVDAQLPRSLARFLCDKGHDAIHTLELPDGNDTTDTEINSISLAENRIVISKDCDFYDSFAAHREPFKLLHIKTGNISNADLFRLVSKNFDKIIAELEVVSVVEVTKQYIIRIQN